MVSQHIITKIHLFKKMIFPIVGFSGSMNTNPFKDFNEIKFSKADDTIFPIAYPIG